MMKVKQQRELGGAITKNGESGNQQPPLLEQKQQEERPNINRTVYEALVLTLSGSALITAFKQYSHELFQSFKTVAFPDRYLQDEGCEVLAESLIPYKHIEQMDLRSNSIHSRGAKALSKLLSTPHFTLHTLILEWNYIGEGDGILSLADSLRTNHTLTFLDLRNNKIDQEGGVALGKMLAGNRTLKHLDLRWNSMGIFGGQSIADALVYNDIITDLPLSGNEIPYRIISAIEEALDKNRQIHIRGFADEAERFRLHNERIAAKADYKQLQAELFAATDRIVRLEHELELMTRHEREANARYTTFEDWKLTHLTEYERMVNERTNLSDRLNEMNAKMAVLDEDRQRAIEEKKAMEKELNLWTKEKQRWTYANELVEQKALKQQQAWEAEVEELNAIVARKEREHSEKIAEFEVRLNREHELADQEQVSRKRIMQIEIERACNDLRYQLNVAQMKTRNMESERTMLDETVNKLRAELTSQKVDFEKKYAEIETKVRTDVNSLQAHALSLLESRLSQVTNARDGLQFETERLKQQISNLIQQQEDERRNHQAFLESEKLLRVNSLASYSAMEKEVTDVRSEAVRKDHQIALLEQTVEQLQTSMRREQNRVQSQLDSLTNVHRAERNELESKLKKGEDENLELKATVAQYELALQQMQLDNTHKAQAFHHALNALKVSLNQFDLSAPIPTYIPRSPTKNIPNIHSISLTTADRNTEANERNLVEESNDSQKPAPIVNLPSLRYSDRNPKVTKSETKPSFKHAKNEVEEISDDSFSPNLTPREESISSPEKSFVSRSGDFSEPDNSKRSFRSDKDNKSFDSELPSPIKASRPTQLLSLSMLSSPDTSINSPLSTSRDTKREIVEEINFEEEIDHGNVEPTLDRPIEQSGLHSLHSDRSVSRDPIPIDQKAPKDAVDIEEDYMSDNNMAADIEEEIEYSSSYENST